MLENRGLTCHLTYHQAPIQIRKTETQQKYRRTLKMADMRLLDDFGSFSSIQKILHDQ